MYMNEKQSVLFFFSGRKMNPDMMYVLNQVNQKLAQEKVMMAVQQEHLLVENERLRYDNLYIRNSFQQSLENMWKSNAREKSIHKKDIEEAKAELNIQRSRAQELEKEATDLKQSLIKCQEKVQNLESEIKVKTHLQREVNEKKMDKLLTVLGLPEGSSFGAALDKVKAMTLQNN